MLKLLRELAPTLLTIAIVLFMRTALAAPNYIPSGSMEPTLQIGDYMLSSKYAYGFSRYSAPFDLGPSFSGRLMGHLPEQGDVVVFQPPNHPGEVWVKRVIGLPGDHLQMKDGLLWINGAKLPVQAMGEGSVEDQSGRAMPAVSLLETLPNGRQHPILKQTENGMLDNTAEFIVPPGHLFMMGDNRDHSLDSRAPAEIGGIGFVPLENLIGRSEIVLGSWDFPRAAGGPAAWLRSLRLDRFFSSVS